MLSVGKLRGGEVRLCTHWSNGNISEGKGQLFGLTIHIGQFCNLAAPNKSRSHPPPPPASPCHCFLFQGFGCNPQKILKLTILLLSLTLHKPPFTEQM